MWDIQQLVWKPVITGATETKALMESSTLRGLPPNLKGAYLRSAPKAAARKRLRAARTTAPVVSPTARRFLSRIVYQRPCLCLLHGNDQALAIKSCLASTKETKAARPG